MTNHGGQSPIQSSDLQKLININGWLMFSNYVSVQLRSTMYCNKDGVGLLTLSG